MPVDSPHSDFTTHNSSWKKIRDCYAGEDAIKRAGSTYLPRLDGQTNQQYESYKTRACFYGATARTVAGLLGAIFRKDPTIKLPPKIEYLEKNVDNSGTSLTQFSKDLTKFNILTGRAGILTDMPLSGSNSNPYLSIYSEDQIINWRVDIEDGQNVLKQVVLQEQVWEDGDDEFAAKAITQYRVLRLIDNIYTQQIYRKTGDKWAPYDGELIPQNKGKHFDFIPFTFVNPSGLSHEIEESPVLSLVNVNLSHYLNSADLEHGLHWTALPTPWISGLDENSGQFFIGSSVAWALPLEAKVGMLEFTGAGLAALESRLLAKQQLMAFLGARLLEDQKKVAESTETKRLQYSGENSVLSSISKSTGEAIRTNLKWAADWAGANPEDVEFSLNADFFDTKMNADEIKKLVESWQAGGLTSEVFAGLLKKGEILPDDLAVEDYADEISESNPTDKLVDVFEDKAGAA